MAVRLNFRRPLGRRKVASDRRVTQPPNIPSGRDRVSQRECLIGLQSVSVRSAGALF